MKVFKVFTKNMMSDYWKMTILAHDYTEAINIALEHCKEKDITTIIDLTEDAEPRIICHEDYKWG